MLEPITDRDPGDEQPDQESLFDAATTLPKKCSCGCTAKNLCPIDAAQTNGVLHKWAKRPRTCLSSSQLAPTDDLPF